MFQISLMINSDHRLWFSHQKRLENMKSIHDCLRFSQHVKTRLWLIINFVYKFIFNLHLEKTIIIALFNNIRTLKFKPNLQLRFTLPLTDHYCNGHPKAETRKMDRNLSITNQECDLLTSLKYYNTYFLRGPSND